jgi:hypothetical protein
MYKIMGRYAGRTEEIDEFDSKEEAENMLGEYRMAYGAGWSLWIEDAR